MRAYSWPDNIKRIRVWTPITDGFVGSIFQRPVSAGYRFNCCSQHAHFTLLRSKLAFHIRLPLNAIHSKPINAQAVAVATPCCPAPVSGNNTSLPIRLPTRSDPAHCWFCEHRYGSNLHVSGKRLCRILLTNALQNIMATGDLHSFWAVHNIRL